MIVLGLDSSTSVTGWAFSENNIILDAGFVDTKKLETTKQKASAIISAISSHTLSDKFKVINLEAPLSNFTFGMSSQQTIITLIRHNAVFSYILGEHYKMNVNLLSVNTMRKQLFGKCRIKGMKSKEFVRSELESKYPSVLDFCVMNKKGKWDERNGDMYDAVVASLYRE